MHLRNALLSTAAIASLITALGAASSQAAKPPRASVQFTLDGSELAAGNLVESEVDTDDCSQVSIGRISSDGGPRAAVGFEALRTGCSAGASLSGELDTVGISTGPLVVTLKFSPKLVETTPGPCTYSLGGKIGAHITGVQPLTLEAEAVAKLERKVSSVFCPGAELERISITRFTAIVREIEEPMGLRILSPPVEPTATGSV